jgi:hypothetical protein
MKYSICCLIYKSIHWLDFTYRQILKYTDLSDCEFFFVANDATTEVLAYLHNQSIPYHTLENSPFQRAEWFINNVYRGYNFGASRAKGDFLVLINSDMGFSPAWLDNLIKYYSGSNCITSRLVESGRLPSGQFGIEKDFGTDCTNYRESEFLDFAITISKPRVEDGGLFMPLLVPKTKFLACCGYPEGNIIPGSDIFHPLMAKPGEPCISGDLVLMQRLLTRGIKHQTAFDSIIYHFQRGESDSPQIN